MNHGEAEDHLGCLRSNLEESQGRKPTEQEACMQQDHTNDHNEFA